MASFLNKSVNYERVPTPKMRRSVIPVPFKNDLTAGLGKIVPCYVQDILPGTSIKMRAAAQVRLLNPFKVPMFDYMKAQFFWFFAPYRLLSAYWEKFIAGSAGTGGNPIQYGMSAGEPSDWNVDAEGNLAFPPLTDTTGTTKGIPGDKLVVGSLFEYMNVPLPALADQVAGKYYYVNNSLPFRAYNLIYNEYFRDENLQNKLSIDFLNSYSNYSNFKLLDACKTRDYFTTALIKPQKSNPVSASLGTVAPVGIMDQQGNFFAGTLSDRDDEEFQGVLEDYGEGADLKRIVHDLGSPAHTPSGFSPAGIYDKVVNLADSDGISLSNLRTLVQINKFTERLAIGGSRYDEILESFYGTNTGNKSSTRPQFLGVGTIDINVQEVVQTTGEGTDLGVTGGRSNSVSGAGTWFKSFAEHGVLLCLMVIRQKQNTYQQGMPRMYSRKTRLDMYWPTFAHISYQPIYNEEIYKTADNVTGNKNREVFGYQEPWQEYKTMPNQVHGDLHSNSSAAPIDYWNFAEKFDSLPTLSSDFIKAHSNNLNRALLGDITAQRPFVVNFRVNADYTLPMPVNAIPGLMDHF